MGGFISSGKLTSFGGIAARWQLRRVFTRHMACGRYGPGSSGGIPDSIPPWHWQIAGDGPGRSLVAEAPKLTLPGPVIGAAGEGLQGLTGSRPCRKRRTISRSTPAGFLPGGTEIPGAEVPVHLLS